MNDDEWRGPEWLLEACPAYTAVRDVYDSQTLEFMNEVMMMNYNSGNNNEMKAINQVMRAENADDFDRKLIVACISDHAVVL